MEDKLIDNEHNSNDNASYLVAISGYAAKNNLWSEADNYSLQMQMWELMKTQTRRYTMGDSSSIPLEVAEELKKSIYFCIGAYCKSIGSVMDNIQVFKSNSLFEIFKGGQKEVLKLVNEGNHLLQKVNEAAIDTGNISYSDTLNALPNFFKNYDISLMAHEIPCDIDYQLFKPAPDLYGIEYINAYLQGLLIENEFCNKFQAENIISLLQASCADHKQDLINVFGFVFNNAAGLAMLGQEVFNLEITKNSKADLLSLARNSSKKELQTHIYNALNTLLIDFDLNLPQYKHYYKYAASELLDRIESLKHMDFDGLFLSYSNQKENQALEIFIDGESMDDESLRTVIEEIQDCGLLSDKIMIIKENIRSVRDLIEIFNICFWNDEIIELYKTFSELEISAVFKYATSEYGDNTANFYDIPFWFKELLNYSNSTHSANKSNY